MALVKGPFKFKWHGNEIENIESFDLSYEQESNDYSTVDGRRFTIDGAVSVSATITLLNSDLDALSIVVPQFVKTSTETNPQTMSTGEEIAAGAKALDVYVGGCENEEIYGDLDIIGCGANSETLRLINCRTRITGMPFENNQIRTVEISFIGEPKQGQAAVQSFIEGTLGPRPVSA